jgi:hypothetical protein
LAAFGAAAFFGEALLFFSAASTSARFSRRLTIFAAMIATPQNRCIGPAGRRIAAIIPDFPASAYRVPVG